MSRVFAIALLGWLLGGGAALAQSNSESETYLHLDPASEQLYQEGKALGSMLTNHLQAAPHAEERAQAGHTWTDVWFYVALGLGAILAFRKWAPGVAARIAGHAVQLTKAPVTLAETHSAYPADVGHLEAGHPAAAENPELAAEAEALEEFFSNVGQDLGSVRKSLTELGCAGAPEARRNLLGQLLSRIRELKSKSNLSGVRPLWQLTGAAEGLLQHFSGAHEEFQPTTLRTLASAVDLLHSLSVPGLRADLVTQPAPKLLTVDDDPISRYAVGSSIKRFLVRPDSATHGEAALAMAEETTYDLIFLDVHMPGMDGFELCSRIHATARNRTTPVIFVTTQSDFEARTKSSLTGGQELIGKPFLADELSLKALTVVLRSRLHSEKRHLRARSSSGTPSPAAQPKTDSMADSHGLPEAAVAPAAGTA